MARHQLRARQAVDTAQEQASEQLTEEQFAALIRQSSDQSVKYNVESAGLQLNAAQQYAISQGLDADKIVIAWEGEGKRGVSASKLRIDQREKLQEVVEGIKEGRIKRVWAFTVSRLFRDEYGIQSGVFMEICAEYGVKVVIDRQVFDFRDDNSKMLFSILVSVAARENKERSKWMMEAKARKALRGEYIGRVLTPGFVIDRDKLLPDGKPNPNYGKYKPYPPHARVTAALYARYRQLNGAFNVLAAEVAQGLYDYPDFDSTVDPRDIAQFRLKKVPGGYRVGRGDTLRNLLTAVEAVGYWKFRSELLTNEDGSPKKNHEGIVPMDDWLFAFNRLSWDTLTGEENKQRHKARASWKPVKQDRQEPILVGLLNTPGGTIQYSDSKLRVMEKRPGHMERSATLVVDADLVCELFLSQMQKRYLESSRETYDRVVAELKRVQENNAKSLVSVDKQIAGYQQAIKNNEDGLAEMIATFGANFNKGAAARLNEEINNAQAALNDLLAKKNAATIEESQLQELCDRTVDVLTGHCDCDVTRRFIRLATDRIELAECSAHFATLTVYWSAPFAQIDVCYIWLPSGTHQNWTNEELERLRELFPYSDRLDILKAFPHRTWSSILSTAGDRGIRRYTKVSSCSLPIQLAWRDYEILRLLGMEDAENFDYANSWVTDVSAEPSPPVGVSTQVKIKN